jgi:hypothetical protein
MVEGMKRFCILCIKEEDVPKLVDDVRRENEPGSLVLRVTPDTNILVPGCCTGAGNRTSFCSWRATVKSA